MKRQLTILLFLLLRFFIYSQFCEETISETLTGNVFDYQTEDCTGEVEIISSGENTNIHGITLIDAIHSIKLKPTAGNKITIIPDDSLDFIDLIVTETMLSIDQYLNASIGGDIENRTNTGNNDEEPKGIPKVRIYPNPVNSYLYISTGFTILNYKILNSYGFTVMEGTSINKELPDSVYKLGLDSLTQGIYYLLIKTEENTFYGNPYHDTFMGTIYKN